MVVAKNVEGKEEKHMIFKLKFLGIDLIKTKNYILKLVIFW